MKRFEVKLRSGEGGLHYTYALDITRARQFYDERVWEITEIDPDAPLAFRSGPPAETLPHPIELKRRAMGTGTLPEMRAKVRREQFEVFMKRNGSGMSIARKTDGTYRDSGVGAMWIAYKQGWEDSK